ncbi:MAG: hypothetical protein AAGA80_10945, partial [Cyanobacteria bacterium P01_F01_bin.143]
MAEEYLNGLNDLIPTVETDKTDYAPGETAIITGTGFNSSSEVEIQIADDPTTPGDDSEADIYAPILVRVDEHGVFTTTWNVPSDNNGTGSGIPDALNATLNLTATGDGVDGIFETSDDQVATTTFTDALPLTPPVQTYFVPLPEDDLFDTFNAINDGQVPDNNNPVNTIIAIAVSAANTIVYYDHAEDGYEADVTNPTQSTTLILGDEDTTNGSLTDFGFADDTFTGGDSLILENDVPIPRNTNNILFDGSDRIQATFPIAVTRGAFPDDPGSLLAGGTEVFNTEDWGTTFVVPVGEDTPGSRDETNAFQYTSLYIMAREDGTVVTLPDNSTQTLNAGENLVIDDVDEGDEVTATASVQAHLIGGDVGSNFELRWYSLTPRENWSNDYYTPVGDGEENGGGNDGPTRVWLYNPDENSSIDVTFQRLVGGNLTSSTVTVPPGTSALSPEIPDDSGGRFFTSGGEEFFALTQTDADGIGQTFDWGHPLIPADQLTSQALVGWGYGNTNNNSNVTSHSVVWVTPVEDATINIDFDGDGTVDNTVFVNALESLKIFDDSSVFSGAEDDQDMSGAIIFAADANNNLNNPVDIAVAWGQDPARTNTSSDQPNSLDLGTVVPPLPVLEAGKTSQLSNDADNDGEIGPGDTLTYTISIANIGQIDLLVGSFNVLDFVSPVFDDATYVANSTTYSYDTDDDGLPDTTESITDDGAGTAFPLDLDSTSGFTNTQPLDSGALQTITFQVLIDDFGDLTPGTEVIRNEGILGLPSDPTDPIDDFETEDPLVFRTGIDIEKSTNGEDADDPTGPFIGLGDTVTWTYTVTNTGNVFLADVVVTDDQGVTPVFQSGDDNNNGLLEPGEIWIYEATGSAELGQYENLGEVTGDPVYADGTTPVPGLDSPTDEDPSNYFGINPQIDIVKVTNGDDGLNIPLGDAINWTYTVTNTGDVDIENVVLNDDILGTITGPDSGDDNNDGILQTTETWIYTATGTAIAGQYNNIGTVTGDSNGVPVEAEDPSSYFGTDPEIAIDKVTNGDDGLNIPLGDAITWTYTVTNTGNVEIENVVLEDDQLGIIPGPDSGDDNNDGILQTTETWIYTATGTAIAGQYDNIGTVTGDSDGVPVEAEDPSSYFGIAPEIDIDKVTNGDDGLNIPLGDAITWTYTVTNTGNVEIENVVLSDDILGTITGPDSGDDNNDGILQITETWIYTATGTAIAGQYNNIGTVTGDSDGVPVEAEDPSSYFGTEPEIEIDKVTNGDDGLNIPLGDAITWTYTVTNTGNVEIENVVLEDDQLGIIPGPDSGDDNNDGILQTTETWIYTATGTAIAGQYDNIGTVTGDSDGIPVEAEDPSSYFGTAPGIDIDKVTNGDDGLNIPVGDAISWTYTVTNTGNVDIENVVLEDDILGTITGPDSGDENNDGILQTTETWIYTATGVAIAGQYNNVGTVEGTTPDGLLEAEDPSSYFGTQPGIDIDKVTNGDDGLNIPLGDAITWTYTVTNTGNVDIENPVLTDDILGTITGPDSGDDNNDGILQTTETWIYTATGTAIAGQYNNVGTITGDTVDGPVEAEDPSSYFGTNPGIDIDKVTNGADGLNIPIGDAITWTYTVTNTGNVDIENPVLTDDILGTITGPDSGDDNNDGILQTTETWIYTATGVAEVGQYNNVGTVTGDTIDGPVEAEDPSSYFGTAPGIEIDKVTNGDDGLNIPVGDAITWTYTVTNTGNVEIENVVLTDDILGTITGPDSGDDNNDGILQITETWIYTATGIAEAGQYNNIGTVDGTTPDGPVEAEDPSSYFGTQPGIDIDKVTNGDDGLNIPVGDAITWTYTVTNTGNVDIENPVLTDDILGTIAGPSSGDANNDGILQTTETWIYTANGIAEAGQYDNIGTITGDTIDGPVEAEDPSSYFG